MSADDFAARVSGVGSLADPVRRSLYGYVCSRLEPLSTDEIAAATGIARHTAKFHLDRLTTEGLLEAEFRRPEGRGGPGAGRPTKFFRRADREFSVTLPDRRYELAGQLLAAAIDDSIRDDSPVLEALTRTAAQTGRDAAALELAANQDAGMPQQTDPMASTCRALAAHGYEPHRDNDEITLANCPFHSLAKEHTKLVCGMNLALVGAITDRLGQGTLKARLEPAENRCCVVVSSTPKPSAATRRATR